MADILILKFNQKIFYLERRVSSSYITNYYKVIEFRYPESKRRFKKVTRNLSQLLVHKSDIIDLSPVLIYRSQKK